MRLYVFHQMRLYVCHRVRLYIVTILHYQQLFVFKCSPFPVQVMAILQSLRVFEDCDAFCEACSVDLFMNPSSWVDNVVKR